MTPQQARNGRHVLRFDGQVLASASSERSGCARWSELVVYGLAGGAGNYVRSKIGRSLVVHRPECPLVTYQMTAWIDLDDDSDRRLRRVPCAMCQPVVSGDGLDPQTMIEATRYTATVAEGPEQLDLLLSAGRSGRLPWLVAEVIKQLCVNDSVFAGYWVRSSSLHA